MICLSPIPGSCRDLPQSSPTAQLQKFGGLGWSSLPPLFRDGADAERRGLPIFPPFGDYNHLTERVNANRFDGAGHNLLQRRPFLLLAGIRYLVVKFSESRLVALPAQARLPA
jgi:hypothetical protein